MVELLRRSRAIRHAAVTERQRAVGVRASIRSQCELEKILKMWECTEREIWGEWKTRGKMGEQEVKGDSNWETM